MTPTNRVQLLAMQAGLVAAILALPLLVLEIAMGRIPRVDVVAAFGSMREHLKALGCLVAGLVVAFLSCYLVLTGWVLAFLIGSLAKVDSTSNGFIANYYWWWRSEPPSFSPGSRTTGSFTNS